jgi:hypothetical protein
MDDIGAVVCAFCGATMRVSREMPASSQMHALLFFVCDTCGASELRIDRVSEIRDQASGIRHQESRES